MYKFTLFLALCLHVFARPRVQLKTRYLIYRKRTKKVFPLEKLGDNQSLSWKKSNCPLIHADTPSSRMPPRNDVRVGKLSLKLNIRARRWNGGDGTRGCRREIRRLRREGSDIVHLPFSRGGTIKIKLENKRGAGSHYKVF